MKGIWNKEKSASRDYAPALDALSAVDKELLAKAFYAVLADGCALMLSATRDRGAICLTLLDGNDKHKVYPTNAAEFTEALTDLVDSLSAASSPPPPTKRAR